MRDNPFIFVGTCGDNPLTGSEELLIACKTAGLYKINILEVQDHINSQQNVYIPIRDNPLITERVWKEERFNDLRVIIQKHVNLCSPVEISWVREYNKLQQELNK